MDEFGVLTERFGLKPQGKSAPMASVKRHMSTDNGQIRNLGMNSGFDTKSSSWNTDLGHDSFFQSVNGNTKAQNYGGLDDYGDVGFQKRNGSMNHGGGTMSDYDSIFTGSNNFGSQWSGNVDDDIFGGMPGIKVSAAANDDVFGSFASNLKQSAPVGDLLGNLDVSASKLKSSSWNGSKNVTGFEELIPGFGGFSPQKGGGNLKSNHLRQSNISAKSNINLSEDPFIVLESTSSPAYASSDTFSDALEQLGKSNHSGGTKHGGAPTTSPLLRPPPKPAQVLMGDKVKRSGVSSIDELEDFARGKVWSNAEKRKDETSGASRFAASMKTDKTNFQSAHAKEVKERQGAKAGKLKEGANVAQQNQPKVEDVLESFFSMGSRSNSVPKSRSTTSDPVFDAQNGGPKVSQVPSSRASSGSKKASLATADDLFSMFGEAGPVFGEFEEVEGESEERRRARLGRQQRTQQRAAQAVADMNQRDRQTQQEQEERRMIAETVDIEIKRWSAGKEGNMRALLSSLHYVLWPECGWLPVPLTDMITSGSVKKVYRKATLCIHPDKVQQRGANLQQKYTAEKVFDILKEAWNKFNSEELS